MNIINACANQYAEWLNNYANWIVSHPVAFVSLTALAAAAALTVVCAAMFRARK